MLRDYSIIIPAYNEEKSVARAVKETAAFFQTLDGSFEILVVDDGSKDKTADIVRKQNIARLLAHKKNRGKGAAIKTGVSEAEGDILLFLDADLSTHPSAFKSMLPLLKHQDIVIGSRKVRGAKIGTSQPWYRIWAGKLFNLLIVRWYLGLPFEDTQCGFKAFKKKTRPLFKNMRSRGWVFDVELLYEAQKRGFTVAECPVEWHHGRESRVRLSDIWNILSEVWRIRHA